MFTTMFHFVCRWLTESREEFIMDKASFLIKCLTLKLFLPSLQFLQAWWHLMKCLRQCVLFCLQIIYWFKRSIHREQNLFGIWCFRWLCITPSFSEVCWKMSFLISLSPWAMIFSLFVHETMLWRLFNFWKTHVVLSLITWHVKGFWLSNYSWANFLLSLGLLGSFWVVLEIVKQLWILNSELKFWICSLSNVVPSHHFFFNSCWPVPHNLPLEWLLNF